MRMSSLKAAALNSTPWQRGRFFWSRVRGEVTRGKFVNTRCSLAQRQLFQISQLARQFIRIASAQLRHSGTRHVFHILWFELVQPVAVKPVHLGERPPSVGTVEEQ